MVATRSKERPKERRKGCSVRLKSSTRLGAFVCLFVVFFDVFFSLAVPHCC